MLPRGEMMPLFSKWRYNGYINELGAAGAGASDRMKPPSAGRRAARTDS